MENPRKVIMPLPAGYKKPEPYVGPHFAQLNQRRQAFVRNYVLRGRRDAAQAYINAGYDCKDKRVAAVNACNLLHREDVQMAVREMCMKEMVALAPMAVRTAAELMDNPQTEPAVKLRAAEAVMNRTGLVAQTEHKVTVEHIGDNPAAIQQARALIQKLGLTEEQVEKMLGRTLSGKVIDATYQEVPDEDEVAALPAPEDDPDEVPMFDWESVPK